MEAHDRMRPRRISQLVFVELSAILFRRLEYGPERLDIVNSFEPGDELLYAIAKAFVSRRHADEHGVAAHGRYILCTQDGRHRRLGAKSLIRVPDISAERRGLLIVSKLDELGCFFLVWRKRMNCQLAKTPAEVHQIFGRDDLVAEDEQLVFNQRLLDGVKLLV